VRAVVQRVSHGRVRVNEVTVGEIGAGALVLIGVGTDDDSADAQTMAEKIAGLRIFNDERGLMNRSLLETAGAVLLVSQFTLYGDARRGRRPSFTRAANGPAARQLYEIVGRLLEATGISVAYGEFGARMEVELLNEGPVTILIDTKKAF
jgi:D-tyrosyl-tRNA(Tyr) deacylase